VTPSGVSAAGTFGAETVINALDLGLTVVWKKSDEWAPGSAAVSDELYSALGRRANGNMYVTGGGADTATAAHNDPHCFVILQLSGEKRWRIWHAEQYMLPGITSHEGQHLQVEAQRFGLDGTQEVTTIHSEAVRKLGPPDLDFVLKPGDLLYVPRGAVHLTSTVTEDGDKGVAGASQHITFGLPVDYQNMLVALGAGPADGERDVPNHLPEVLTKALKQRQERLLEARRSFATGATDADIKERMKVELHGIVDEMIENTTFVAAAQAALVHGHAAVKNYALVSLDKSVDPGEW
jgi:hypothetical protein